MKLWKKYRNRILALTLVLGLIVTTVVIPGVFAQEEDYTETASESTGTEEMAEEPVQEEQATEADSTDTAVSESGETDQTITENQETSAEDSEADFGDTAEEISIDEEPEESEETGASSEDEDLVDMEFVDGDETDLVTEDANSPYKMTVSIDGTPLNNSADNNIVDSPWSNGKSKTMNIQVDRNTGVSVDTDKQYVLSMKVSDVFYFNGVPDPNKINGVEKAVMIQNTVPQVNKSNGSTSALDGFSPYSGEIRLLLNTSVETVTVTDIGISYNTALAGYTNGTQTISNPISVSLITVDEGTDLRSSIENTGSSVLKEYKLSKAEITTGSLGSSGMRNAISANGFKTDGIHEQDVVAGKNDEISYGCGAAGPVWQVYKSMTVVYHCPYITVDGNKYYLEFDENDTALTSDKQGIKTGYKMAGNAVYNETEHTITYTFEDIYFGGHTVLFYTPKFTWPEDLNIDIPSDGYKVEGSNWEITEQTCYTSANSTLNASHTPKQYAIFMPEGANIVMTSSAQAAEDQHIAKRAIYRGLTTDKGFTGALGFFDVHNDGTEDSPEVKISFDFNTDKTGGATYYVTQVNLPGYGNTGGTDVDYVLEDKNNNEISGKKHYDYTGSFNFKVSDLNASGYYIKSLSYNTHLEKSKKYHAETAHLWRNRPADFGLFFGYMEGEIGKTASATMTIKAVDSNATITADGKNEITSTETSTISDQDYIAYTLSKMSFDDMDNNSNSKAITAGQSATLKFSATVSSEEYAYPASENVRSVNGYHVFRDGVIYVCLPENVSIPGKDQVSITGTKTSPVISVRKMENATCKFNGVDAYWWEITADGINITGGQTFGVEIQLATDERMSGIVWDFQNCVAVRTKEQQISWGAAGDKSTVYSGLADLTNSANIFINTLGKNLDDAFKSDFKGMNICNGTGNVKLNIARAEAKLDVATSLEAGENAPDEPSVNISDENTDIIYHVTVSSNAGGTANDFTYYIPVVKKDSEIDSSAMVVQREYGLNLKEAVSVTSIKAEESGETIFDVAYTTVTGLNSTTIRGENVTWTDDLSSTSDYSNITAIKISTKANAFINTGASYQFTVKLKYDNSANDFSSMAGSIVRWRSFGRYTYKKDSQTTGTTNTYPSSTNAVTLQYVKDTSSSPTEATLDTSAITNTVSVSRELTGTFVKKQEFRIKEIKIANGTQLITTDPTGLTGADANSKFKIDFGINNLTKVSLTDKSASGKDSWTVSPNEQINLKADISFSKALTDSNTDRYIILTVGNDNITITCRIDLIRIVKAADAKNSGVRVGENYIVPEVDQSCSISGNSAFTALYVVENFVPGNYTGQHISWKNSSGNAVAFPADTQITMMEISSKSKVNSYWYYKTSGSEQTVDLKSFTRMSGTDKYRYDTDTTSDTILRYMFVVDFENQEAETGSYKMAFGATEKADVSSPLSDVDLSVEVENKTSYTLSATSQNSSAIPSVDVSYTVNRSAGNDSYKEGKTLALVLTPSSNSGLPVDARIQADNTVYTRNSDGQFIIPIGTIADGTKTLCLLSAMYPDEEKQYTVSGQLYLAGSNVSESPVNGEMVGSSVTLTFTKAVNTSPALKVTGVKTATVAEWSQGQEISINVQNIPTGGSMTATAYAGITDNQKETALLSSIAGIFKLENGTGTYDSTKTSTGKLVLSGSASPGTYRIMFEIKDADSKTVLTVPYYFIVQ